MAEEDEGGNGQQDAIKTITLDEIMGADIDEQASDNAANEEEEDDSNYYEVFVNEIRRKEQLD